MRLTLGQIVRSFFEDYLKVQKGLQPASIRSYRDALKLFLCFVAQDRRRRITRLSVEDLSFKRTLRFLHYLEEKRGNHVRTRNQRLVALRTFFDYLARRVPEMLPVSEQVALVPVKRAAPRPMQYLEQQEIRALFRSLPTIGRQAPRNRTLLLFLYNTGARVQEVADLRVGHLDLGAQPRVRLHGKGDKWRMCPLWEETARQLRSLLQHESGSLNPENPVFVSRSGSPLTRFGIYKIVRRCAGTLDLNERDARHVSPHLFRHTAAVHLLESGVELTVIRGWLGHVSLETTNRYAEITPRIKEAALRVCEPSFESSEELPRRAVWRDDETLLAWLDSL
ncbi:site-specific integrase [Acidobacteria bacterium AH-259-G07]|nr:site-specific integrase [Acidobacteria bacterium AH-259-G07]